MDKYKPIGIFDSGVGGLTVTKEIIKVLPYESIIYLADMAHLPYGDKSAETVIKLSIKNAEFLVSKGVKVIVVACNTASSVAIGALRQRFNIPIIGVVEPAVNEAIKITKNQRIGVIGTYRTVNAGKFKELIEKYSSGKIRVFQQACPLFVPLVEEGFIDHPATYYIAEEYLKNLKHQNIDTLILGCTHYPLLKPVIQKIMGDNVKLVDTSEITAKRLKEILKEQNLLADEKNLENRFETYYTTDLSEKVFQVSKIILGKEVEFHETEIL